MCMCVCMRICSLSILIVTASHVISPHVISFPLSLCFFVLQYRLAHCLLLREQTWSQIHIMQNQEKTVETPDVDDLYDIEI